MSNIQRVGITWHAADNAEPSNKMASYTTDNKLCVITAFLSSTGSCVAVDKQYLRKFFCSHCNIDWERVGTGLFNSQMKQEVNGKLAKRCEIGACNRTEFKQMCAEFSTTDWGLNQQHKKHQKSKSFLTTNTFRSVIYDAILSLSSDLPIAKNKFSSFIERSTKVIYNCVQ